MRLVICSQALAVVEELCLSRVQSNVRRVNEVQWAACRSTQPFTCMWCGQVWQSVATLSIFFAK
jgi:hypothetical protein